MKFPFVSLLIGVALLAALLSTASADAACYRMPDGSIVCDASSGPSYGTPVRNTVQRATTVVRKAASAPVRVVRRGIFGRSVQYSTPSTSYGSSGQYQSYGSSGSYQTQGTYTEAVEAAAAPEKTTASAKCDCGCEERLAALETRVDRLERIFITGKSGIEEKPSLPAPPTSSLDPIRDDALVAAEWRLREQQRVPSLDSIHDGAVLAAIVEPRR